MKFLLKIEIIKQKITFTLYFNKLPVWISFILAVSYDNFLIWNYQTSENNLIILN